MNFYVTGRFIFLIMIAGGSAPHEPAVSLKIMTYNIERGLGENAGEQIGDLLIQHRPDIVCLQEAAWPKSSQSPNAHQVQYLADVLGYDWDCLQKGTTQEEIYGMGILVKGRIHASRALKLPGEKPYALWSEIEIDGQRLIVVSVHARHLDSGPRVLAFAGSEPIRHAEMKNLMMELQDVPWPVVVAGDFNTLPLSPSYLVMSGKFRDSAKGENAAKYTRNTEGFPARIDYIFLPKESTVNYYDVLEVDYSDHRPVLANIQIPRTNSPSPSLEKSTTK